MCMYVVCMYKTLSTPRLCMQLVRRATPPRRGLARCSFEPPPRKPFTLPPVKKFGGARHFEPYHGNPNPHWTSDDGPALQRACLSRGCADLAFRAGGNLASTWVNPSAVQSRFPHNFTCGSICFFSTCTISMPDSPGCSFRRCIPDLPPSLRCAPDPQLHGDGSRRFRLKRNVLKTLRDPTTTSQVAPR